MVLDEAGVHDTSKDNVTILRDMLLDARQFYIAAQSSEPSDRKRFADRIQELQSNHQKRSARASDLREMNENLDTEDLEEIMPPETQYHEWKKLKPTPKFVFDIRAPYPIKDFKSELPSTSFWLKTPIFGPSSTSNTFNATLKNKWTVSATATVHLYGHRKDKYKADIEANHKQIPVFVTEMSNLSAQISEQKRTLDAYDRCVMHYQRDLNSISKDISRLENPILSLSNEQKEGNIFWVAKSHGLETEFPKQYTLYESFAGKLSISVPESLYKAQCALETQVATVLENQAQILSSQREFQTRNDKSLMKERERLVNKVRAQSNQAKNNLDELQRFDRKDPNGTKGIAARSALEVIESFDERLERLVKVQGPKLAELQACRVSNTTLEDARSVVQKTRLQTEIDLRTTAEVRSVWETDKWSLPVLACFTGNGSAIDGWHEIWEGIRMGMQ